jgi:hypothetical protein
MAPQKAGRPEHAGGPARAAYPLTWKRPRADGCVRRQSRAAAPPPSAVVVAAGSGGAGRGPTALRRGFFSRGRREPRVRARRRLVPGSASGGSQPPCDGPGGALQSPAAQCGTEPPVLALAPRAVVSLSPPLPPALALAPRLSSYPSPPRFGPATFSAGREGRGPCHARCVPLLAATGSGPAVSSHATPPAAAAEGAAAAAAAAVWTGGLLGAVTCHRPQTMRDARTRRVPASLRDPVATIICNFGQQEGLGAPKEAPTRKCPGELPRVHFGADMIFFYIHPQDALAAVAFDSLGCFVWPPSVTGGPFDPQRGSTHPLRIA